MTHNRPSTLTIERTICCLVAALGAILLWVSVASASVSAAPAFQDVSTPATATSATPEPATLGMLICGIMCVASKLRRGGI